MVSNPRSAICQDETSGGLVDRTIESPLGSLVLVASRRGLVAVLWPDDPMGRVPLAAVSRDEDGNRHLGEAASQLADYFAGRLRRFDLSLDARGTPFQHRVWDALGAIPFGETRSYRDVAVTIGQPTAMRAVGAANGRNPLSIIVPCHRVIGSSGSLTGFAGGLEVKRHLLALEGSRLC